jgi:hypothetical protein
VLIEGWQFFAQKGFMNIKQIHTILLVALLLTSCAPATTVVSPTGTAAPLPTASPAPATADLTPTPVPQTAAPTVPLSTEGPWLVYRHNALSLGYGDLGPTPEEFVLLNQDGSGRTSITLPDCDNTVNVFLLDGRNSANSMAKFGEDIYIFRPSQATGLLMYRQLWYSDCQTFFRGDKTGGLLASLYQATNDVSPELILYELPDGDIRERFPLVRCPKGTKACEEYRSNWSEMMRQQPQWSPNGRYLAFVAVLDAASSDLFVYDTQDGGLRRLTNGPDWVGPIEWSLDGTRIIMQELLNDGEYFFAPYSKPPSSVWSVSVRSNEIKLLYSTGDAYTQQNILFWLDEERFFAYEGFLVNADQAHNLRLVDMEADTNRILFDGDFIAESYDPIHETFALYELHSEEYPQGIYLVSAKDGTIRYLEGPPYNLNLDEWDSATGLFLSDSHCETDPSSRQAFDHLGNFKCVPEPTPTPDLNEISSHPAPNGQWSVSVKDGLWLEAGDKTMLPVSQETASDVIWCPDSNCFFFSVVQSDHRATLYHVSLPELTVKMVDEGIDSSEYHWLGVGK